MLKALNVIGLYVTDVAASVDFYTSLGFDQGNQDPDFGQVWLGEVRVSFTAQSTAKDKPENFRRDAFGEPKGLGIYLNVEVDDVDRLYDSVLAHGYTPSSEPRNWPWGQREFVLRDPDDYKLVFYQKI